MLLISKTSTSLGKIAEPDEITKLARLYGAVESDLQAEFRSLTPLKFTEIEAMAFKREITRSIQVLNRGAVKWSQPAVREAYIDAAGKAKLLLEMLDAILDPSFDERIHKRTIIEETELTNEFLLKANVSINLTADTYTYLMRKASAQVAQIDQTIQAWDMRDEETIAELLDEAIILGASRWKTSKLVMAHFEALIGEGMFININGRNYNIKKYSRMVARTRLRKVQSQAVLRMCEEYNNDLVQVSDHGTSTEICLPFEGNVYSTTGRDKDYPVLPEPPPFHPNCQHNISPTTPALIERNPQRRVSQQET